MNANTSPVMIEQIGAALGAQVEGVDLRQPVARDVAAQLRAALDQHSVLVFRGQQGLTDAQQIAVCSLFGVPGTAEPARTLGLLEGRELPPGDEQVRKPGSPPYTDRWHIDITYCPRPPVIGTLFAKVMPKVGGDTALVSLQALYDSLSAPMQQFCEQLRSVNSIMPSAKDGFTIDERIRTLFPDYEHPLVMKHPRNGRKSIYVQAENTWLLRLVGANQGECDFVLRYLRTQLDNIAFQFRWKWSPGDFLIWDQLAVAHMGLGDHYALDPHRVVHSVWAYADGRPQGVGYD